MKNNDDNGQENVTDIAKAREIRTLRQGIEQYSEVVKIFEGLGSIREMVDEAVMYDPLLTTPVPEEKRFERNAFIKTLQKDASGLDEMNERIIKEAKNTIGFLNEEIDKLT